MQSKKTITIDKALETFLLLDFVRRCDEDVREGRCKPLAQAFAEHRERVNRNKNLHENIFNNNQIESRERHR